VSIAYDGIVLAGGKSRRMAGPDKTRLMVGNQSLVSIAVAALGAANRAVVVGPGGDVVESPPGGGPVAAIAAGLTNVSAPVVVLLAADLPFVTTDAVDQLVRATPAVAIDDDGRPQYLLSSLPSDELRASLPDEPAGVSLRSVIELMSPIAVRLAGQPPPWWDCDSPADLDRARRWHVAGMRQSTD
jgi:molybdopterin-guanine dinucleotide biosynthesis protein A